MHQFGVPVSIHPLDGAPEAPGAGGAAPCEQMTLAEAAAYAQVTPVELLLAATHGRLRPVLIDPFDGVGTLMTRPDVDAWCRRRSLSAAPDRASANLRSRMRPLVQAELERREPDLGKMRPTDPDVFR